MNKQKNPIVYTKRIVTSINKTNQLQILITILILVVSIMGSFKLGFSSGLTRAQEESSIKELRDFPNMQTLRTFLEENKVDEKEWVKNEYTCYTFSTDLVDAAQKQGYRAQVVVKSDYMGTGISHARVQFWVDDMNAWILVEPQDDGIIETVTSYTRYGTWYG